MMDVVQIIQSGMCVYIAAVCLAGTPQGYVKHMGKFHSDGKSLH